ncbi:hypothetical protein Q9189_006992 [Teloschistes chrysophthalmus]
MEDPPLGMDLTASQVPRILGVNIATFCLAVIAIVLRFTARRLSRAAFWWDDWLMVPAIFFSGVMCLTSIIYMIHHGLGRHIWVAPKDAGVAWAKGLFISEVSYTIIICSIKFSLLAFYWRIFKQSKMRVPIYVLGTIVSCWGIAVILVTILQCLPCLHPCVVGVSIARFTFIIHLNLVSPDITWNFVNVQIWTGVESHVAIICGKDAPSLQYRVVNVQSACLPSLRPLLNLILFGSVDRSNHRNDDNRLAGGLSNHAYHVWNSHLKTNQIRHDRNARETTDLGSDCGFMRLSEEGSSKEGIYIIASNVTLNDVHPYQGIKVRTDVYVDGKGKE